MYYTEFQWYFKYLKFVLLEIHGYFYCKYSKNCIYKIFNQLHVAVMYNYFCSYVVITNGKIRVGTLVIKVITEMILALQCNT